MKKWFVASVVAVLAFAGNTALAAAEAHPAPTYESSGVCHQYSPTPDKVGTAIVQVNKTTGFVTANSPLHRLTANTTYRVYLAVLTVRDGQIVGCWYSEVTYVTTSPGGAGQGKGGMSLPPDTYEVQMLVFNGSEVYASSPVTITVP